MDSLETLEKDFVRAYDELSDALFRHCFFRVSDREKAKDLVQETFVKTWEYIASGKKVNNLKTFLYRVASNLIIDHYRKHKDVSLDALREFGFDRADLQGLNIEDEAEFLMACRILNSLEEKYREIIIWRYMEGLSPKEIAEISGISENAASVRLNRAVEKLKEKLKL